MTKSPKYQPAGGYTFFNASYWEEANEFTRPMAMLTYDVFGYGSKGVVKSTFNNLRKASGGGEDCF